MEVHEDCKLNFHLFLFFSWVLRFYFIDFSKITFMCHFWSCVSNKWDPVRETVLQAYGFFLYLLETSEHQRFSDIFRGYRKRPAAWNGLLTYVTNPFSQNWFFSFFLTSYMKSRLDTYNSICNNLSSKSDS